MLRFKRILSGFFSWGICLRALIILLGFIFSSEIMAAGSGGGSTQLTLTAINTNLSQGISKVARILQDIAVISGVGFVLASLFKFHQHKLNPTQVPLSQGITLLAVGAGLAAFPHLIGTATQGVFGVTGGKVGGTAIANVIGS